MPRAESRRAQARQDRLPGAGGAVVTAGMREPSRDTREVYWTALEAWYAAQ